MVPNDGSYRPWGDFRRLNYCTTKDNYTIPYLRPNKTQNRFCLNPSPLYLYKQKHTKLTFYTNFQSTGPFEIPFLGNTMMDTYEDMENKRKKYGNIYS